MLARVCCESRARLVQRSKARQGDARDRRGRSPIVVIPARPARPGDEHVVRAHIPHASTALSGWHAGAGARTARLVLPTLNRVSRGLSRRAPPAARRARGARRRFLALSAGLADSSAMFRHTLTFAREEFFQQERMRPSTIS